ncbi:hypothetical protein B0H13DRAFT_2085856, partial [Mycena leptocephala]
MQSEISGNVAIEKSERGLSGRNEKTTHNKTPNPPRQRRRQRRLRSLARLEIVRGRLVVLGGALGCLLQGSLDGSFARRLDSLLGFLAFGDSETHLRKRRMRLLLRSLALPPRVLLCAQVCDLLLVLGLGLFERGGFFGGGFGLLGFRLWGCGDTHLKLLRRRLRLRLRLLLGLDLLLHRRRVLSLLRRFGRLVRLHLDGARGADGGCFGWGDG